MLIRMMLCMLALAGCAAQKLPAGQVMTSQGIAQGVDRETNVAFLGIEYARANRWAPPGDGPSWDGVRKFDTLGPACPQDGMVTTEDCLFLNVFVPPGTAASAQLPVLFWIHGGGFREGQGGEGRAALTREGMIVVTFNYRLGLLGFHDWPGWDENEPRNFGQADMVKALNWVASNIEAFGGNPENITLAGHSAGGMGVQLMMVDPRVRGLFARAISDAGYGTWPFPHAANPSEEERSRMRYASLEYSTSAAELVSRTPYYHLPFVGGSDLSAQPADLFKQGRQAPVPYISGGNDFDGFGVLEGAGFKPEAFLERYLGNDDLRAAYASDLAISRQQTAYRLFGDMRYVYAAWVTTRNMSKAEQPGYLFLYTRPSPGLPGAGHGAHYGELLGDGPSPLRDYLSSFIKTGSLDVEGLPVWAPITHDSDFWMLFEPEPKPAPRALKRTMLILEELSFPGDESTNLKR